MTVEHVLVVGASLAGTRATETLRAEGFDGRITLVGAEPYPPYDRPPLSKQFLAGTWGTDRLPLLSEDRLTGLDVDLRLGKRATDLDLSENIVSLHGGERIRFDGLVVATGSKPRTLPDATALGSVHTLRSLDDSIAIRDALARSTHLAVIGAGFIGSEVAATARTQGLEVTVIEALAVPLARGLGPQLGAVCGALHVDHGVNLRLGVGVTALEGHDRVERVVLSDGSRVDADLVVVGVGVEPEVGWLRDSGLELHDGIVCDATLRAAPGVFAAGDIARWPNAAFDEEMRLEHWTNAADQGAAAAANLLAGETAQPFEPVPYVWSDQYSTKIQILGRCQAGDDVRVVHGSLEERRFVAICGRGGRLRGAVGFASPRRLMSFNRLLHERATVDEAIAHAAAFEC